MTIHCVMPFVHNRKTTDIRNRLVVDSVSENRKGKKQTATANGVGVRFWRMESKSTVRWDTEQSSHAGFRGQHGRVSAERKVHVAEVGELLFQLPEGTEGFTARV